MYYKNKHATFYRIEFHCGVDKAARFVIIQAGTQHWPRYHLTHSLHFNYKKRPFKRRRAIVSCSFS